MNPTAADAQRVLVPTPYKFNTCVKDVEFKGRPTIVDALTDGTKLLFVGPTRAEKKKLIFPQGRIELGQDDTFFDAAFREGSQELGLDWACFRRGGERVLLGECLNPVPWGRVSGCHNGCKHMFVMAIRVWYDGWVRLNSENRRHVWVKNSRELLALIGWMRHDRPVKFWMIINAVDDMAKRGILSWSSGIDG